MWLGSSPAAVVVEEAALVVWLVHLHLADRFVSFTGCWWWPEFRVPLLLPLLRICFVFPRSGAVVLVCLDISALSR